MIIGIDFDNTIINYSDSFKILAKTKKLIPQNFSSDKVSIRNYLRDKNLEDKWTALQGEAYGKNIMRAGIYDGVLDTFEYLLKNKYKIKIISHKTKYPFIGKKINLRISALKWIEKNLIKKISKSDFSLSDIFFENTIERKIAKVQELKCDIFIDDLPEVLNLLPKKVKKILFSPVSNNNSNDTFIAMNSWREFIKIAI